MNHFYSNLKKSWNLFRENFKHVIILILIDIAFFICMSAAYTKVWEKAMVHANAVMEMMNINIAQLVDVQSQEQLAMLAAQHSGFMAHYQQIGYYVGMLLASLLAFWCIFQGVNWFLTEGMARKEQRFWKYVGKFTLLSFIWWLVFLFIAGIGTKMSFQASMSTLPIVGKTGVSILMTVLMFILFCISFTSYTLIPKYSLKQIFRQVFIKLRKNYKQILQVFLFIAVVLMAEYFFFMRSFIFGGYAAAAFAVIVIFPTLSWIRFYTITALEN